MGSEGLLRLGVAIGGAVLGSYFGGIYFGLAGQGFLTSAGFMAGNILGGMIFPVKSDVDMPQAGTYPTQNANKGIPVPIVYGTARVAGNIIWMGDLQAYTVKHSSGGGKGLGGGDETSSSETRYRRSFLIGVCEGTAEIRRAWKGKTEISVGAFTRFNGFENSGIAALTGEDYSDYKSLCCAFFENYELGNSQTIPNFVFEVTSAGTKFLTSIVCANGDAHVLDEDLDVSQTLGVTGTGCTHVALDALGNTYLNHGFNADGIVDFSGIDKFDKDFNQDASFFTSTIIWGAGVYDVQGARVSPDGKYLYVLYERFAGGFLRKYDLSTGAQIGSTVSVQGWIFACNSFTLAIDSTIDPITGEWDYKIYIPDVSWSAGAPPRVRKKTNVYDKDLTFLYCYNTGEAAQDAFVALDWGKLFVCGWSDEVETFSICYRLLTDSNPQTQGAQSGDDELWTESDFYSTGAILTSMLRKGDYIYACGNRSGDLSIWKFDENLSVIASADTGFSLDSCWLDNRGRIIARGYYNGAGDKDANIYIFDEDLTLLETVAYPENAGISNGEGLSIPRWIQNSPATDENPSYIIKNLLTNNRYGAGLVEADLINTDTFDDIAEYCENNNLLISLSINEQKPIWDWVDYICSHFGGYRYRSGGKISLGVFRDEAGVFTLTQDNLAVASKDEQPVQVRKRKYTETFNRIEIQWTDRDANYDVAIAVANDEVDQRVTGQLRKRTINLAGITDPNFAQKMAYRMLIESMYRHSFYAFNLTYQDMLLEVNDVGIISDGFLLSSETIRITSVSESKDGKGLAIEAVEDGARLYPSIAFASQQTQRTPDGSATLANARIMLREDINAGLLYLSMVPGNASTNGYEIYRSYDDTTYEFIGRATVDGITGGDSNSYGTLLNILPAYTATIHRANETLLVNIGTLTDLDTSITDDNFFNGRKILRIGDEIIGYHNAVETSTAGVWEITGLMRGLHNTLPTAHTIGDIVETMDVDFTYILREADVGKTIYFKAVVFYANQIQDIADVTAYSTTVEGKHLRPLPVSLMRIHDNEGSSTYETDDVIVDWYFSSRESGYGRGGYGNAPWGAFEFDTATERMNAILKQTDDTEILNSIFDISEVGLPMSLLIEDADRSGNNPYKVELSPIGALTALESREIQLGKV